jgi:hypothetical protein
VAVTAPLLWQTLARARRRVRLLLLLRHGATGVLAGVLVSGVLLLLLRTGALSEEALPLESLVLPPLLGLLAGAAWTLTRRLSRIDVARLIEQRLDLKERLSTAVTLLPDAREPLALRQIADAEAHAARGLDLRKALPLGMSPRAWAALAGLLVLALAWLLPTLPIFQSPRERAERAAVRREGERIVRIAKELEQRAAAKRLDQTRRAANQLHALGRQMQRGRLDKQKALIKVAKLTEQIKRSQQALAQAAPGEAPKSLPAAGRDLQKALDAAPGKPGADAKKPGLNAEGDGKGAKAASSEQAMRAAQKALGNADMPSLAEQLSRLAEEARQGRPGEKADREKLAGQLGALARALKDTSLGQASPDLQKAAEAMKAGDLSEAAKSLGDAARKIAESARKNADSQSLEQMARALEAGQNGQSAEGDLPADQGEGAGEKDAFGGDGKSKNGKGAGSGDNPGNGQGAPGGMPRRFGAGPQAGKGRAGFRVTQGGPQTGPRRQDPGFKPGRDDKYARLYAPRGKTPDTRLRGRQNERGKETVSFFRGAPEGAAASVPYYEVYNAYAPAAEKALSREDIPQTYKKQVKDYFDSLNPGGQ